MMSEKIIIEAIFLLTLSLSAFADQAIWIKKSDADKAIQRIHPGMTIRRYCAPCGDSTWSNVTVKEVKVNPKEGDFFEVEVNGEGTDLAYTYIEDQGKWRNLAMLLSLNVSEVPESLSAGEDRLASEAAEPEKKNTIHQIDKRLEDCIAKDNSTAGMTNCIHEAYQQWDAELNKVYSQLRDILNPDQKKALKQAQSEWIQYRDAEFRLIDSLYDSLQGTMFTPMRIGDRAEIVKERVLELESYLELMRLQ